MNESLPTSQIQLGSGILYDRFTKQPVCVFEEPLAPCADRPEGYPDRNLESWNRVELIDYEEAKGYRPCWLHSSISAYSHSSPVTKGCWKEYLKLDEWILGLDGKLSSYQGPLYKAMIGGAKWFRLSQAGPAISHGIWRSVLQARKNHQLQCYSFLISNIANPASFEDSVIATSSLERKTGLELWANIKDEQFGKDKARTKAVN